MRNLSLHFKRRVWPRDFRPVLKWTNYTDRRAGEPHANYVNVIGQPVADKGLTRRRWLPLSSLDFPSMTMLVNQATPTSTYERPMAPAMIWQDWYRHWTGWCETLRYIAWILRAEDLLAPCAIVTGHE